jgi:hypothetical protein
VEAQLSGQLHSDGELVAWLASGALRDVDRLVVWDAALTDAGAAAIAACRDASSLRELDLSWNHIGPAGAAALARMPALRSLRLYHNDAGVEGAAAIAEAGGALESLNLCGNALGDRGLTLIARGTLANLRSLALGWNELGPAGVAALVAAPWPKLEFLNIRCNHVDGNAAALLLSGALPALRRLGVDENPLGRDGLAQLMAAPGFAQLEWLNLGGTGIDDHAAADLAKAGGALRELRVHDNGLSQLAVYKLQLARRSCEVLA